MAGVLAEAQIGDAEHRDMRRSNGPQQAAYDVILIERCRAGGIFATAIDNAEDQISSETFFRPAGQPGRCDIDRHLEYAGHGRYFLSNAGPLADEDWNDYVAPPQRHALEHLAELWRLTQSPWADREIGIRFVHCRGIIPSN